MDDIRQPVNIGGITPTAKSRSPNKRRQPPGKQDEQVEMDPADSKQRRRSPGHRIDEYA